MLKQMDMDATTLITPVLKALEVRDKAKNLTRKRQEIYTDSKTWTCYGWHWKRL